MIRDLLQTVLTHSAVTGLTAIGAPLVIGLSVKDEEAPDFVIRTWARNILRAAGARVEVVGLSHLPEKPCVLVCNHQSHFDVLVILGYVPRHIRFVAKAELFKIPLFGQALAVSGNVKVDRQGGEHDRRATEGAIAAVRRRTNMLFFAEGTRSDDGSIGAFKKGAALLALQAQVPLVPMAVAGTREILPKGTAVVHGGRATSLVVGEPISTTGLGPDARDEVTARAREAVSSLYVEALRLVARRLA